MFEIESEIVLWSEYCLAYVLFTRRIWQLMTSTQL